MAEGAAPPGGPNDRDERIRRGREWLLRTRGIVFVHVMEHDADMIESCFLVLSNTVSWFLIDCIEWAAENSANAEVDWQYVLFRRWQRQMHGMRGAAEPWPEYLNRSRDRSRSRSRSQ